MTDLAAHLVTLSAHLDRIGVTNADVLRVDVYGGVMTIHLRDAAVDRLVRGWGDTDTLTTTDHVVDGVVHSHHHRVAVHNTDRKVVLLWLTTPATAAQAA